jgi:ribosomal peptide maturation radical SAM protein 1
MPTDASPAGATPIVLVTMPLVAVERPSLALGLLKSILDRAGLPTTVAYANLWFLDYCGIADYAMLDSTSSEDAMVDWIFAEVAFPDHKTDAATFLERAIRRYQIEGELARQDFRDRMLKLRERAPGFIDWTLDQVLDHRPRIVGCTSTFQQHVPSLALLRQLKERAPEIVTIMGGANCETVMGLVTHRHFPWVDYVVSGEADGLAVPLFRDLLARGRDIPADALPFGVLGPVHRRDGYPRTTTGDFVPRAVTEDMRGMPLPDYGGYFSEVEQSLYAERIRPGLPMEFSRGCWWGERSHCTFCGLNGTTMSYRAKPAETVAGEIREMAKRYGSQYIEAVDNILAIDYFDKALPQLREDADKITVFFEVKANLKRHEVEQLAAAGVRWVQPGIESLDTRVLRLMAKGTTAANNVQLLKWCRQFGVRLSWSLLWGFPGEDDVWYADMAKLPPLLHHLQPPPMVRLRYHRYSPYFRKAADFGLDLQPVDAFRWVYPLDEQALFDQVYYFDDLSPADRGGQLAARDRMRPGLFALNDGLKEWRDSWADLAAPLPLLAMRDEGGVLLIDDTRSGAVSARHRIEGLERDLLLAADEAAPAAATRARLARTGVAEAAIDAAIARLIGLKLLIQLDSRLVGLALRHPVARMLAAVKFPGGYFDRRRKAADVPLQAAAD